MHRLAVLFVLAACAAPALAPATSHVPVTRYSLQPLRLAGGEGRHSSAQSTHSLRGALELHGTQASLTLEFETFHAFVHCPPSFRDGRVHSMQQCADEAQQAYTTRQDLVLRGELRRSAGKLVGELRDNARRLAMTCDATFVGLACSIADERTGFGPFGDRTHRMVFAASGSKRFALQPRVLTDGETLAGAIELTAETATVELAIDGGAPIILPGTLFVTPAGLVIEARTSATRTFTLVCAASADGFACEVTADRSVLGRADHLYGPLVLVADTAG